MTERQPLLLLVVVPAMFCISLLFEHVLHPKPRLSGRPPAAWMAHLGFLLTAYGLLLAILDRGCFAAVATLALEVVVVVVSEAKYSALREPFIYQDFEYFTDAIRHPRLYLPFLEPVPTLTALAAGVATFYAGLTLEPALYVPASGQLALCACTLVVAGLLCWAGALRMPMRVDLDPVRDLESLGLVASITAYARLEGSSLRPEQLPSPFSGELLLPTQRPATLRPFGSVVVVQSESFFDPRRTWTAVRTDVLQNWDRIRMQSSSHGRLLVDAWGANTVRTEFSFLSGVPAAGQGIHRFNPYRKMLRSQVPTLAAALRARGYRTICMHPYPASFYRRDRAFPLMGFDEFLDLRAFAEAERCGPFVSDLALAEAALKRLGAGTTPVFLFLITMENHGPLHLEAAGQQDFEAGLCAPPWEGCDDLAVYLKHLRNADRMVARIVDGLSRSATRGLFCMYGDHVPILPQVYRKMGAPDGRTDYLLWDSDSCAAAPAAARDLAPHELGTLLFRQVNSG